jgi:hypothetical protein
MKKCESKMTMKKESKGEEKEMKGDKKIAMRREELKKDKGRK